MKKSELNFKVAALTDDRRYTIFKALSDASIEFVAHERPFIFCYKGLVSAGSCACEFDKNQLPERTLECVVANIRKIVDQEKNAKC